MKITDYKFNKLNKDFIRYFPKGTGLLLDGTYQNVKTTSFPVNETVTTIADCDFITMAEDDYLKYLAWSFGLGNISAVIIYIIIHLT